MYHIMMPVQMLNTGVQHAGTPRDEEVSQGKRAHVVSLRGYCCYLVLLANVPLSFSPRP